MNDTPTTPHAFTNLGGKRRVPNPKEYKVGSATAPVYTFPATKAKPAQRTYYMQGQRPACGAHAGTSFLDSLLMQKGGKPLQNNTPRGLWINIKKDGSSPSDGTSMDRVLAELQQYGQFPFEPLENNVTFDDADYANTDAFTPAVVASQSKNTLVSYGYVADMSFNGLKQAINDFGAVIILFDVCARLYTAADGQTSWQAKDVCPLAIPTAQFPVIDGHFMVADYYDEDNIYGANSFSQQWGLDGDFSMQADYMPWVIEAAVGRVSVPVVPPAPVIPAVNPTQTPAAQLQNIKAAQQVIDGIKSEPTSYVVAHASFFAEILANLEKLLSGNGSTNTTA